MESESAYSYEDGPSFDCDGPPPLSTVNNGVKVDLSVVKATTTIIMGITPVKSNKTNTAARDDDATVLTEPVTPSPFKTSPPSGKKSLLTRRRRKQKCKDDTPFDEMPFDEGSPMDEAAADTTLLVLQRMEIEMEPAVPESRESQLLPPRPNRQEDNLNDSFHSASTFEEEAEVDYEADVEPPHQKGFGEYPHSDDDTIGTATSEHGSVPTVRRRNNRKKKVNSRDEIILTDTSTNRPNNKPGVEEWCLSNVFDNIATDAALDVADWFTDGYVEGKKNVKTLVYECLVPLQENAKGGTGYDDDGEEMVQLLRATHEKSDLRLKEETSMPKRLPHKKVSKKERKIRRRMGNANKYEDESSYPALWPKKVESVLIGEPQKENKIRRSMDSIDDDDDESNFSTSRSTKVERTRKTAPKKERRFRRSMGRVDGDNDESNNSTLPSKNTNDSTAKAPTVRCNLAAPTVLTRTRSLLEDTPTKDTPPFIQRSATLDEQLVVVGNLKASHSFDSTSTTKTDNFSVHHENNDDEDDDEDNLVEHSRPGKEAGTSQGVPNDDDSVIDQAEQMAALVGTKPSVPPPQKQTSEDRDSEATAAKKQLKQRRLMKQQMAAQKLTMAKAKEVLKAAKFLEMEPETKYTDTQAKKKEWPPKKAEGASNPSPSSYKPPSRKSQAVDRFGYVAALKDKSNDQKAEKVEEWCCKLEGRKLEGRMKRLFAQMKKYVCKSSADELMAFQKSIGIIRLLGISPTRISKLGGTEKSELI
ncbi:MAG: hypothetical protein SGBAC_007704 [Bacillariaceae sp.]